MMTSIRLDMAIKQRLDYLASATGRTKAKKKSTDKPKRGHQL